MQQPKTFEDILELQKILDGNIVSVRDRDLKDIQLSMIAEIIEFNEETKDSHKTWKTKEWDKEKELEELTDIFFFMAQWINYTNPPIFLFEEVFNEIDLNRYADCHVLIYEIMCCTEYDVLKTLMKLSQTYGYTKKDILKTYWKKWQKNMKRIGKEWN